MRLQLISIDSEGNIERVLRPIKGYLHQRQVAEDQEVVAPEGYAYVPILAEPEYDASTQKLVKSLTQEYDGWEVVSLTQEEIEEMLPQAPMSLTPRQIRIALLRKGIEPSQINDLLASNKEAAIEWEYASEIRRDHPLVGQLAATLNMSDQDVKDMFAAYHTV